MGSINFISFPYLNSGSEKDHLGKRNFVVFFGADFRNLTREIDYQLFIKKTNEMLDYIRLHFPECEYLYLPHPNETDEYTLLNLQGFRIVKNRIAEDFLYENADSIAYVFSACSWASVTALSMGLKTGVFLDVLRGIFPEDLMTLYRGYFSRLPDEFFIRSFGDQLPKIEPLNLEAEHEGFEIMKREIGTTKKVWVLTSDPALALRGAILIKELRKKLPELAATLVIINGRRWDMVKTSRILNKTFNEKITIPFKRVWYSKHLLKIIHAFRVADYIKKLAVKDGDVILSFAHVLFEENCLISYHKDTRKILFIENRFYDFSYGGGAQKLPADNYRSPIGGKIFRLIVEPLLGLHPTILRVYKDGRYGMDLVHYPEPLNSVFNSVFVLMPWIQKRN